MVPGSARNWIAVNPVQQSNLNNEIRKYDSFTVKNINRSVAFTARSPSHSVCVRLLCAFAHRTSGKAATNTYAHAVWKHAHRYWSTFQQHNGCSRHSCWLPSAPQ